MGKGAGEAAAAPLPEACRGCRQRSLWRPGIEARLQPVECGAACKSMITVQPRAWCQHDGDIPCCTHHTSTVRYTHHSGSMDRA